MNRASAYLKRAAPTLLSVAAGIGVIATTILSSKAAIKAEQILRDEERRKERKLSKWEVVKTIAPVYIPTVATGAVTIVCVFGANYMNKRQQIALTSAFTLTREQFRQYRDKVKDIYGKEAHRRIMDELSVEKAENAEIEAPGLVSSSSLDFHGEEESHIFCEAYSGRHFESTFSRVLQAEYHLNRNFVLGGCVSLNDFFKFLGLEETDYGGVLGWSMAAGYEWIDFDHRKVTLDGGTPCFTITVQFEPEEGFADW